MKPGRVIPRTDGGWTYSVVIGSFNFVNNDCKFSHAHEAKIGMREFIQCQNAQAAERKQAE